jgi:hypothetical protein
MGSGLSLQILFGSPQFAKLARDDWLLTFWAEENDEVYKFWFSGYSEALHFTPQRIALFSVQSRNRNNQLFRPNLG